MAEAHRNSSFQRPWYRRKLAAEIIAILVFKVVALTVLYLAFFSSEHRVRVDPEARPPFLGSASIATEMRGSDV